MKRQPPPKVRHLSLGGGRMRSSSELWRPSGRRASLDIVTEKEVALNAHRNALALLLRVESQLSVIEDQKSTDGSVTSDVAESAAEEDMPDTETSLKNTDVRSWCGSESQATTHVEDDREMNEVVWEDVHATPSDEERESLAPATDANNNSYAEDKLHRKGAKYYAKRLRRHDSDSQTSESEREGGGDGVVLRSGTSTARDRDRRITYDMAMGVISPVQRDHLIIEHEQRKVKKSSKDKKEKAKYGKLNNEYKINF